MNDKAGETSVPAPRPKRRRGGRWLAILLIAAAGGGWLWWEHRATPNQSHRAAGPAPVEVTVANARFADVPVYFTGLGTVQAFNTVTVRSRVDGEVDKIAFTEGQMVKAGDLIAQIDPRPFQAALDQTKAKLAQDQAQLANAKLDLERSTKLAQRDYATKQQVDTQTATVNQLSAQIKGDQAAIENAQTQLGYTTIRSPLNGRVGFRLVDQGNIVHAADPNGIVVITQLEPIATIFTAPERELPAIAEAVKAGAVPAWALAPSGQQLAQGSLTLFNNQIDQASGSIRLKATFPNQDHKLWPGQSISVRIQTGTLKHVVTIASDSVQRGTQGLYAWVVSPDKKAELRPIEVGLLDNGIAVANKGIKDGEAVVTAGQYRLKPGVPVKLKPAPDRNVSMAD
jgi:multidrug efflux system membrane fusion protein